MKINRVKSERDIKGGQFYIRAVVNCHGDHWIEVFRIVGKAYNTESKNMKGFRKITTVQSYSYNPNRVYVDQNYIGDLGVGRKGGFLFEYSSKVHNYLKTLDLREFYNVVNNIHVTDERWSYQLNDWKWQKEMDDEMHAMMVADSENY